MKPIHLALRAQFDAVEREVTLDMQNLLRAELAGLGELKTMLLLQHWRVFAFDTLKKDTARQRRTKIERLPADMWHWAHYAAAAWLARALVLTEHIEQADLQMTPKKWAGPAMFSLVDGYESDDFWLWPFESPSPWPEDVDEDGDDED